MSVALARHLRQRFRRRLLACDPIAQGWEADLYGVTLAASAAGRTRRLVAKLYLGDRAADKCAWEGRAMRALAPLGIPLPAVRGHGSLSAGKGALAAAPAPPYLLMDHVQGRVAGDLWTAAGEIERGALLDLFCRLLAQLHALDWRRVADALPPAFAMDDPSGFVEQALAVADRDIERFGHAEYAPVVAWLRSRRKLAACPRLAVLHGDYHESNLLVAEDGRASILDWAGARIGDPRWDLAWTLLLIDGGGALPGFREAFLERYLRLGGAGWCVEQLGYFDVLAALRRLLNASIACTHGAACLGLRPGAELAMRRDPAQLRAALVRVRTATGIAIEPGELLTPRTSGQSP